MTEPWIILFVIQWALLIHVALTQIGLIRKVLPFLDRARPTHRPIPVLPPGVREHTHDETSIPTPLKAAANS